MPNSFEPILANVAACDYKRADELSEFDLADEAL